MCDFDQRSGRGVFRMGFTLAVASLAEWLHTVFLELTMQNTKDTQSRNQPPQDNQSKDELQYHEGSAQVVGKSLNVNENDVRDQNRPGSEAVKDGQKCHEDSADVVGNSLHVNENDVRDQNRSGTEAVKGGERSDADNKNRSLEGCVSPRLRPAAECLRHHIANWYSHINQVTRASMP